MRPSPGIGRSLGLMGSANVVAFGAGVVRQKIFAVFLGPAGFGVYGVLASLFDLLSTVTLFGAPTGLLREAATALRSDDVAVVRRLLARVRKVLVAVSGGLVIAAWVLGPAAERRYGVPGSWVLVLALGLPAVVLTATSESVINAFGAIRTLALSKILTTLSSLLVMAALVGAFGLLGSVLQLVTGAVIASAVSALFLRRVLADRSAVAGARTDPIGGTGRLTGSGSPVLLKAVFAVGLAQTAVHAAGSLNQFLFRSWIVLELGDVDAGLYQGALGLSRQYTAAFAAALFVYAYPLLSRVGEDRATFGEELRNAFRFVLAVAVPVALLLMATRDLLVAAVFTAEFSPMVSLMAWTLPADVIVVILAVLRIAVLAAADARVFLYLGLGFEVVYAASFLVGLHLWGLEGAVAAYGVAALVGVVAFTAVVTRIGEGALPLEVLGRLLGALAVLILAYFLPLSLLGRGTMVLAALAWIVLERHELRRAFS